MTHTKEITIDHDQSEITFEFVGLHYANPGSNSYKYQLEGFDENWVNAGNKRSATYTNLSPGVYTFKVNAANADGIWAANGDQVQLTVLPPWYRTWWAYSLFGLLLISTVLLLNKWQRERLINKERQRTKLREAELRVEEENKRRADTEQLGLIGRSITSSLSLDNIIDTIYQNVNDLMDATIFGVGIYNEEKQRLEFPATKEKGEMLPAYAHHLDDDHRISVYCFKNQEELRINNYQEEYKQYVNNLKPALEGEEPRSVIYLPLIQQDKVVGVLTTQSFQKDAYSEYHLNLLRNLANYAAIAIDNASAYRQLNQTLNELKEAQTQLVQQEKLASLGQLTAGIAHEIKNPLNFVNNFSDLSVELIEETKEELSALSDQLSAADNERINEANEILNDIDKNLRKIHEHGSRADSIVKSMLQHSRDGSGKIEPTEINELVKEYVNLSFHGMRAGKIPINVDIEMNLDEAVGEEPVIAEDFSRVIVNLCNNAFDAMREKLSENQDNEYKPRLTVRTYQKNQATLIEIEDNGLGIPKDIKDKVFQPFYTTKKGNQGTGLGLSISNDIVKAHGGTLDIYSEKNNYTKFRILIGLN